jgi:threonine dehydrogenase-like Zn-dependent dehydrogenase
MRTIYAEKNIPRLLAVRALKPIWPGVIWSPISHVRLLELPSPPLPGPRWLRVRNRQCGIDGTDLSFLHLDVDLAVAPAALPGIHGFYLGHETVGEVTEVGPEVTRFAQGDRVVMELRPFASPNCLTQEITPPCVYCERRQMRLCENASKGLAPEGMGGGWGDEYIAHEMDLYPIPDDMPDDQACLIEPTAVAVHGVLRRPPRPGDRVLVIGAGAMGLLVTQALKALVPGCELMVMARYTHQAAMAHGSGADEVITDKGDSYAQIAALTGAKHYSAPMNRGMLLGGFDLVYDCVGSAHTISDGLRWARADGALVLVGTQFKPLKVDLSPVWYQEVDLIGTFLFGTEQFEGRTVRTFDLASELIQGGKVHPQRLITHRFPFSDYQLAIHAATDKTSGAIKVVLQYE